MTSTATADHDLEPLPLRGIGWAISLSVFAFGAWGYLTRAGIFGAADAVQFLQSTGAGFLLLAALGGVMQYVAATGARAIRRAKSFKLDASRKLSIGLVVAGGAFTAYTLHNAFDMTGMLSGSWPLALVAWLVSIGVAFCEIATWWVDESLRSEAETRRAADIEAELKRRQGANAPAPFSLDADTLDVAAMSDEAIAAGISAAASVKKRLENERARRATAFARSNS